METTPPIRHAGLEDSVLALVKANKRGITPSAVSAHFGGRAVSSQLSRLVKKELIQKVNGAYYPLTTPTTPPPAPASPPSLFAATPEMEIHLPAKVVQAEEPVVEPVEEMPEGWEAFAHGWRRTDRRGTVGKTVRGGEQLGCPSPYYGILGDDVAGEWLTDDFPTARVAMNAVDSEIKRRDAEDHPLQAWIDTHRDALDQIIPAPALVELERLALDAAVNADVLAKGAEERQAVMRDAADLRLVEEILEEMPGANFAGKLAGLAERDQLLTALLRALRAALVLGEKEQPERLIERLSVHSPETHLSVESVSIHKSKCLVQMRGHHLGAGVVGAHAGANVVVLPIVVPDLKASRYSKPAAK